MNAQILDTTVVEMRKQYKPTPIAIVRPKPVKKLAKKQPAPKVASPLHLKHKPGTKTRFLVRMKFSSEPWQVMTTKGVAELIKTTINTGGKMTSKAQKVGTELGLLQLPPAHKPAKTKPVAPKNYGTPVCPKNNEAKLRKAILAKRKAKAEADAKKKGK